LAKKAAQAKTPSIDIYVDGALLLISGEQVSPQIVAAAISRVWRKNRFPPSISELLDEFSEMTKAATSTRHVITKMIVLRDNAEDALIATGDLPSSILRSLPKRRLRPKPCAALMKCSRLSG
jgi:hypothetical protein